MEDRRREIEVAASFRHLAIAATCAIPWFYLATVPPPIFLPLSIFPLFPRQTRASPSVRALTDCRATRAQRQTALVASCTEYLPGSTYMRETAKNRVPVHTQVGNRQTDR